LTPLRCRHYVITPLLFFIFSRLFSPIIYAFLCRHAISITPFSMPEPYYADILPPFIFITATPGHVRRTPAIDIDAIFSYHYAITPFSPALIAAKLCRHCATPRQLRRRHAIYALG